LRYLILLGGVAAAIAAYTVYWFMLAGQFEDGVDRWITAAGQQGTTISYDDMSVVGYPFRLVADIRGLDWTFPSRDGSLRWQADRLRLVAEPWRKGHVILLFTGTEHMIRTSNGEAHDYIINAGNARASLVTRQAGAARFAFAVDDLDILASRTGQHLTVSKAQLYLRDIPPPAAKASDTQDGAGADADPSLPPTAQLDFMIAAATLPEGKGGSLGRQIEDLQGQAVINGSISGLGATQLRDWAGMGGTVDVAGIKATWGSLVMEAAGTLTLDEENRPLGAFESRFKGIDGILGAIQNLGAPRPDAMRLARSALDAMAEGRKGDWVTVPFTLQNGFLYMGSIPLATLSPVRADGDAAPKAAQ
jgi:hypothetical protein